MIRASMLFFLIFVWVRLFAQDAGRQQLVDASTDDYLRIVGKQSALYYGKEQEIYQRTINHPYLLNDQFTKARLSYNEVIYYEAMLRLDLNRDELIIASPDFRQIVLTPKNVDFAELHGKHIIYFQRDNLPGCPSPGYYYLLHSGKCKVLEKQVNRMTYDDRSGFFFNLYTYYYLYKDDAYYSIRNQRGLLKALGSHKKELKRFISVNHLQYRDNAEMFLILTVNEYEKLSGT